MIVALFELCGFRLFYVILRWKPPWGNGLLDKIPPLQLLAMPLGCREQDSKPLIDQSPRSFSSARLVLERSPHFSKPLRHVHNLYRLNCARLLPRSYSMTSSADCEFI